MTSPGEGVDPDAMSSTPRARVDRPQSMGEASSNSGRPVSLVHVDARQPDIGQATHTTTTEAKPETKKRARTSKFNNSEENPSLFVEDRNVGQQGKKRKVIQHGSKAEEDENESAEDSDEEGDPYDPNTQKLPNVPTAHPSFALAEKAASDLLDLFRRLIEASNIDDEESSLILQENNRIRAIEYGSPIRIGLVGDSGTGKSSLINSILGLDGKACVSAQGNAGEACTFVVQEFVQCSPKQKSPFAAEIVWYGLRTRTSHIKEYLRHYYDFFILQKETMDEPPSQEDENLARTAEEVFLALFSNKIECGSKDELRTYLSNMSSNDDSRYVSIMLQWTQEIIDRVDTSEDASIIDCHDPRELHARIEPYTRTVKEYPVGSSLECSPWPLVRLVRIGLDSRLLNIGITLVDLPGVSDTNLARVNATKSYLRHCDYTIVVGEIKRAKTDPSIQRNLKDAFSRRMGGTVIMVVTHSDDIDDSSSNTMRLTLQEELEIDDLISKRHNLDSKIARNKASIKEYRLDKTMSGKVKELREEVKNLNEGKKMLQAKIVQFHIKVRNDEVERALIRRYRESTKDTSSLPVFCVSNKIFGHHLRGYVPGNPPDLTVEQTNIPKLVGYIYNLPSKRRIAALAHHCQITLPTFLSTIQMSCSNSKLERNNNLEQFIGIAQRWAQDEMGILFSEFRREVVDSFIAKLTDDEATWLTEAEKKCKTWQSLHPATYKALVRKYGKHQTKNSGPMNLTDELLKIVSDNATEPFNKMIGKINGFTTEINAKLDAALDQMRITMQRDPASTLTPVRKFFNNLEKRSGQFHRLSHGTMRLMKKALGTVRIDTTQDSEDCFLAQVLKPIYEAAYNVNVSDLPPRVTQHMKRREVFTTEICKPDGIFTTVRDEAHSAINNVIQLYKVKVRKSVDDVFVDIRKDFRSICETRENVTPEAKKLREDLQSLLPDAEKFLSITIAGYLEDVKQVARASRHV